MANHEILESEKKRTGVLSPVIAFGILATLLTILAISGSLLILIKLNLLDSLPFTEGEILLPGTLLLYIFLFSFLVLGLYLIFLRSKKFSGKILVTPLRAAILFSVWTLLYTIAVKTITRSSWGYRMNHTEDYIFLPAAILLVWSIFYTYFRYKSWYPRTARWIMILSIGLITFTLYHHVSHLLDWQNTPSKVYWNDLAEAILQGRLYLINPSNTHDLTLFNGKWYVPNPPLPALIYLPLIALFSKMSVNAIIYSEFFGAINVVLVYLILTHASLIKLIPTNRAANIWLTVMFALGTPHWWLAMLGQMWYFSQILTLTFAALAVLLALHRKSPWLIGTCLGLAILSRPNVFTLWPFLLGIAIYFIAQSTGLLKWKPILNWSIKSVLPVIAAVALLLSYNFIRFENFLDFGYITINGADYILDAVRKYGMFNVHFIPINLKVMLFSLPEITLSGKCLSLSGSKEGFSMFITTPALIYVFRGFKKSWPVIGALISVLFSVLLLLMYHNTGAEQYGYRYILDFILPFLLLLGIGVGEKPSWVFKGLVVVSIIVNLVGILWWFGKLC